MENLIKIVCILLVLGFLSVCSREESEPIVPAPIKFEKNQKLLIAADNKLGFNIYHNIFAPANKNSNILISPISLNKSFAVILYSTQKNYGIKRALHLTNLKKEDILTEINELNNTIFNIDENSRFKISTKIATNYKNYITAEQKKLIKNNADLEIAHYSSSETESLTEKNLNTAIFNIQNEISLNCNLRFQTGETESPFYLNPNQSTFVETLICESDFNFYSDEILQAIELPLGRGNFNALVILPETNYSLESVKNILTQTHINKINKSLRKLSLSVYFPKLDIDYTFSLNKSFEEKGFLNLFKEKGTEPVLNEFSQSVKLKTVSKFASSRTLFDSENNNKSSFFIDRPFVLIITEKYSGAILFIGQITNP